MNAVERIQAAITRLETLKDVSTPGPWGTSHWSPGVEYEVEPHWNLASLEHATGVYLDGDQGDPRESANADLIVTLHRTIDAQLAILRGELDFIRDESGPLFEFEPGTNVLALADAILGGES